MIQTFTAGPLDTNCYLVEREGRKILFDAPPGSFELIDEPVDLILLTHSHWDHIADCAKFKAPVYVHAEDAENLRSPGSDGLPQFIEIEGVEPAHLLQDGETIEGFEVIHTPGHCPGSVCFYREGTLISGDLIFKGAIGTLSLPTAEPERMWASLERIAQLPPDTKVFPGHGPATTIEAERR
jgi:hydroxyacylglutathione hydrolase